MVTLPFKIPVTAREYRNRERYIPEHYKGPNIREQQKEFYQQDSLSKELSEVIIFRRNQAYNL